MNMASSEPVRNVKWAAQLNVADSEKSRRLPGDKITLPPSALEQLLAAATVTIVAEEDDGGPQAYNPFDPRSYAYAGRSSVVERQQNLPNPLTFRLVNPVNGNIVYAGVREFSASEDEIELSSFVRGALGINDDADVESPIARVTVHAHQLAKGTYVRFRPLESGYDPDDWKALLERQLRHNFTTLTKGEVVQIHGAGHDEYRFLVDEVQPDGDAICIVDTDLEVDIEALNEEQARETLKKRLEKTARPLADGKGSSAGGVVEVGKAVNGTVIPGDYVDYELRQWDRSIPLVVELESEAQLELFGSSFSSHQRERPRESVHELGDISDRSVRTISLSALKDRFSAAEVIYITVHGSGSLDLDQPSPYVLHVNPADHIATEGPNGETHEEGDVQCKNCKQWVPQRTLMLHENFCYRNNVACPQCGQVYKKQSQEWKEHWHCEHDEGLGNSRASKTRHDAFFHEPMLCKACGYHCRSMSDLAHHRTSACPGKEILCQFCHLLVPQQGSDDLDINDPEVLLSGLTPHELLDGATTTECHVCSRIVRLRDMATHIRHHDLDRLHRTQPHLCRNINCGHILEGVDHNGQIKGSQPSKNDIGLCDSCYGPLYNSAFDPEHKAFRRRVERRYMTQLLTGCGKSWCHNHYCKTGRLNTTGSTISTKEEMTTVRPIIENILDVKLPLYFCVDEPSQRRRLTANMMAEEAIEGSKQNGYELPWCVAALEAAGDSLDRGRDWLTNHAPRRREEQ